MKKKHIFNSVVVILVSQVLVKILGLLYKLYLANKDGFGDAGNAIYNSGYQIYALLLTISSIGVPNAVAKMVAECKKEDDANQVLKASIVIFSIVGLFGSITLVVFSKYISNNILAIPESRKSIIALAPSVFNVCIISVLRGYYNGIHQIQTTAKSQTIEQLMKTIFTVVFVEISYIVFLKDTTIMAAYANFATTIATLLCLIYLAKKCKLKKTRSGFKVRKILEVISISFPISLSAILASMNRNIDSITVVRYLKNFIGENSAKIQYGVLSGKIDVLASVPISFIVAITTTIIPTISSTNVRREENKLTEIVTKYLKYTIILILPCSIGMILFSKQILFLLYGNENGSLLLQISSVTLIFVAIEQVLNAVLQAMDNVFIPAIALLCGVIVKIISNMFFLNKSPLQFWYGGVAGCCIGTLECHIIAFFISYVVLKKKNKINLKISNLLLKPVLASCIMAVGLYYTYFLLKRIIIEKVAIILAGLVALLVYISSIFLLRVLKINEITLISVKKMEK